MRLRGQASLAAGRRPVPLPVAGLPRLLPTGFAAGPAGLADHLGRYGPLLLPGSRQQRDDMIAEVTQAGLTGRGGAAFPTGRKLAAVAAGQSPVVVANGTEGEPASSKDKVLLALSPHLVLDGAVLAARLVGARKAVIVAHPAVADIVAAAAAERGLADDGGMRLRIVTAAERFTGGEASAVVHWIGRGVPTPTTTPPRLSERGLGGAPTLVQNVETLAHLALIGRYGAIWFRSVGTEREPGSMLVTVLGPVREPSVYEIAIGTPVGQVLELAGGPAAPIQAVLLGGFFGTWVDGEHALPRPFSAEGLAGLGAGVGAGLVAALPAAACGLRETARVARYLADESAGQCGPCLFGLDAIADQLERLAAGDDADLALLRRWLGQVDGRGACSHPSGTVRLVRSALSAFGPEIDAHASGWCRGFASVLPVPPRRRR